MNNKDKLPPSDLVKFDMFDKTKPNNREKQINETKNINKQTNENTPE
jgi:hypothetical protein